MALLYLLYLSLYIAICLAASNKVCLYSGTQVLEPLMLYSPANCPVGSANCMNSLYKYSNYQYGGPATLKPTQGEIVMFLSQDPLGRLDFVSFLNANMDTTMKVFVQITGALPTNILLYDDPTADGDTWAWNSATNSGNFSWVTKPTFTDGVIIGHINFTDNYCLKSTYRQTNNAISKISIMTGNVTNPSRIVSQTFVSGNEFQFCQYPVTATQYTNVTCPGLSNGAATISITFGPAASNYQWTDSLGNIVSNTASISNVRAGTYNVHLNANGCTADRSVVIREPALVGAKITVTPYSCTVKGSASGAGVGGAGSYSFQWYSGSTQFSTATSVSDLNLGTYSVCVTDGCGNRTCQSFTVGTSGCCGDNICNATLSENCVSCPADCLISPCGVCGDGACDGSDSCFTCEADCGKCCVPGTYVTPTGCVVCPPGSKSTTYQAAQCDACPANTYSAGGNETCLACPANTISTAGSGKCAACPVGQVRAAAAASCSSCGTGSYAEPCGTSPCSSCPPGTISTSASAWTCQSCPPGTFQANAGQTACEPCPANSYSASKASVCSDCPTGLSSPSSSTHLVACA